MLVHLQPDVPLFRRLKPLVFDVNGVKPNRQQRHQVVAGIIRGRISGGSQALRQDFDAGTRDHGARLICHRARKTAAGLTLQKRRGGKRNPTENYDRKCPFIQHLNPLSLLTPSDKNDKKRLWIPLSTGRSLQ